MGKIQLTSKELRKSCLHCKYRILLFCLLIVVFVMLLAIYPQYYLSAKTIWPSVIDTTNVTNAIDGFSCGIKKDLIRLYNKFEQKNVEISILRELEIFIETIKCSRPEEVKQKNKKSEILDVCPEVYKGAAYGLDYGFKQGFLYESCSNAKPLSSVITILFNAITTVYTENSTLEYFLHEIEKLYPNLIIIVALLENMTLKENLFPHIKIVTVTVKSSDTSGVILNKLISKVETPYVYIVRDIEDFTYHCRLQRLIGVLGSYKEIALIGGAFRNSEGYWYPNCYQTILQNYYLQYKEGYYKSLNECMFCDYFFGSFAAKTKILKNIEFDLKLPSDLIYEELFFEIRNHSYLAFSCPDVLSFLKTKTIPISYRSSWLQFAKMHELNKIVLPNETTIDFTCDELELNCSPYSTIKSFLLPLCCQSVIIERFKIIIQYLDLHNISYYIIDGTLLGAVKLGIPLPWDLDADILMDSEKSDFLENNDSIWTSKGFTSVKYTTVDDTLAKHVKYRIRMYYNDLYFELFSTLNISDYTDLKYNHVPTKVKFANLYVNSPINPGLVSRNQFGREILKHSQNWAILGQGLYSDYKPGSFRSCSKPWHHACLDNFPADGNMAFRTP